MGLDKNYIFIVLLLFLSSSTSLPQEYGYDIGAAAYPSYFTNINHTKLVNHTAFSNLRRSLLVKSIDVSNFGAHGDGTTDDTQAFENAWKQVCSSSDDITFIVPNGKTYLLKPITFSGPCKSHITMQIAGSIVASEDRSHYQENRRNWLVFNGVDNLVVEGGGKINGNGKIWWQNSCKINKNNPCMGAPTALRFYKCTNLLVDKIRIENAQQMHLTFDNCRDVRASNIIINAPQDSPNTDAIHVTATQNIQISSCTIATGDDCISIVSGSQKVRATNIICGPGHGISIGSLGSGKSEEYVSDVVVNNAKLSGTTNGLRIKTWQGGSGSASNIIFQNVQMQNVKNPIIIDQNYCDQDEPCSQQGSAVEVKSVVYQNIKGTSASNAAISFNCSNSHPCQGVVLQNVKLVGVDGEKSEAVCNNVKLQELGTVSPSCT